MNIVVFGAGDAGRRAIAAFDPTVRVIAVSDNDASKHGHFFSGHPIVAPSRIHAMVPDRVVIASMYWREIVKQLEALGLDAGRIVVDKVSQGGASATPTLAAAAPGGSAAIPDWMSADLSVVGDDVAENTLVSVILPTRDRAHRLGRAIDSVLGQSHSTLELLVVDDGSLDGTSDLLDRYVREDSRIRVHKQGRLGVSAARNRGLSMARGALVAYLDSDNRWHPDYLKLMVRGFRDPTRKTGYAGFNVFDLKSGRFRSVVTAFDFEQLRETSAIDLNVFMHRRELVARYGGFVETMTRLVDWELILRYTRHHPPFVVSSALADYFQEDDGTRITETEPFLENRQRLNEALATRLPRAVRMPGPLRVAVVQHEFPVLSQTFVQAEIAKLIELGVRVSVFFAREAYTSAKVPATWDVAKFGSREELARLLTSRGIDLVHTHFAVPHPADAVVPVCERLDLPFTVKPHAFDIFRRDHDPRHHIARTAGHPLCSAVYCEGEYHRRFLVKEGVPDAKLAIVRNIFPIERYWVESIVVRPQLRRLVGISRFVEKKGFHLLIPAFRDLADPQLRLDLYGYGEERARLEALAHGDPRIVIHDGPREPEETAAFLRDADLFVLPCMEDRNGDTDGLPTVLMEAMAAGVLVLTTPLASTPDLVQDAATGLLVDPGSVRALGEGLQRALAMSEVERQRIIESARVHLVNGFDPELNTRRLISSWGLVLPEVGL